jgi:beta-lactamase regulating signal transducer with metallopeptidase domain
MVYCLAEGSVIAAVVAAALRLAPERNSRTRFAVWLATLTAVVLLPLVQMGLAGITAGSWGAGVSLSSHSLLTLSARLAEYIVLAWAVIAGLGLLRVAASLFQVHRLRRGCAPINPEHLGVELQTLIHEFSRRRPAAILVSSRLDVPTAIGFFRPSVLIPAWMVATVDREELKYVLLHELAHLQRWDDWTNLLQKLAKAVFFFHPGVWWIERKLSLDREMACDDAVLAQAGSPRLYARCLARVAEKSFLRRQIVLAQAAVDRMRQLTLRVARILSADSQRSTRLWKPALPMVAAIALLGAISTANVPNLVSVKETKPVTVRASAEIPRTVPDLGAGPAAIHAKPFQSLPFQSPKSSPSQPSMMHMASFRKAGTRSPGAVETRIRNSQPKPGSLLTARSGASRKPELPGDASPLPAKEQPPGSLYNGEPSAQASVQHSEDAAQQYGAVLVVMTSERTSVGGVTTWKVNMWELRLPVPAEHPTKPIPRKT